MGSEPKPVVVITGQTASGKSAAAMSAALEFGGEIICADSRTVYRGMDIGTAKPSAQDRGLVPHHGLDLVGPDENFSAAEFQKYASLKVNEIHGRGRLPIIVGGTGLYIDGFVYGFSFAGKAGPALRAELDSLNIHELQARAEAAGIDPAQTNFQNPRHLARAIERGGAAGGRYEKPENFLLLGLTIPKEQLHARIKERVDKMFQEGLIDEVQNLINRYGAGAPGLLAPGYKAAAAYLGGTVSLDDAKDMFKMYDRRLAKRQQTWFKRNKDVAWCAHEQEINNNIRAFLAEFDTI